GAHAAGRARWRESARAEALEGQANGYCQESRAGALGPLESPPVVLVLLVVERQLVISRRMDAIQLVHEVVPGLAQLHHRHDRPEVLTQLGVSNVRGQPLKQLVLVAPRFELRGHSLQLL